MSEVLRSAEDAARVLAGWGVKGEDAFPSLRAAAPRRLRKRRTVHVEDDVWEAANVAAEISGESLNEVLCQFIKAYGSMRGDLPESHQALA